MIFCNLFILLVVEHLSCVKKTLQNLSTIDMA